MSTDPAEILDRVPLRGDWLKHQDVVRLRQRWREIYAAPLYDAEGVWALGNHDWHVFSHGYSRYSADGAEAVRQYVQQVSANLFVMFDTPFAAFRGDFEHAPHVQPGHDVYVCDAELHWTMAFTHEAELGPYFAKADSVW